MLECANDGNDSKNEESEEKKDNVETGGKGEAREEQAESSEGHQQNSPVLGLLTGNKTTEPVAEESKAVDKKKAPSKGTIKTALRKKAQYLRDKSEYATSFFWRFVVLFYFLISIFMLILPFTLFLVKLDLFFCFSLFSGLWLGKIE